jgi:CRISPR-associated protein Csx17
MRALSWECGVEWEIANKLSEQVVTADERRKPANQGKLISSEAFNAYREVAEPSVAEALDAIANPFLKSNSDHPLFLSKGIAGRAHIWRTHWEYVMELQRLRSAYRTAAAKVDEHKGTARQLEKLQTKVREALDAFSDSLMFEGGNSNAFPAKGKGTPFFSDAIKSYNIGSAWVTENYPFNALAYVLAVEGAFAMRGSVGRTLAATSRRFAAFPFVFETGEEMVDDSGEVKGVSSALWLPLWDRPCDIRRASLVMLRRDCLAKMRGLAPSSCAPSIRRAWMPALRAGRSFVSK